MKTYTVKVDSNGDRFWHNEKNQLHREDGPAVEYTNGYKSWWINGKYHREDGPAIEYTSGNKEWWINGNELTEEEFNNRKNKVELSMDEIATKFGVSVNQLKIKK